MHACMHARTHACWYIPYSSDSDFFWGEGGGGQLASHETFFWIASDTDYGLNTLHGVYFKHSVQPLSDLCKDCVSRGFTQVKFYVSGNSYKFSSHSLPHAQEKFWKFASKCIIKRLRQVQYKTEYNIIKHPLLSNLMWHTKYISTGFLSFAPRNKNLHKVRFMWVKYYVSRGVTVL